MACLWWPASAWSASGGLPLFGKKREQLLTLRESPPARPKTATLAKSTDYVSGFVGHLFSNDAQRSCFDQGSVGARRETKERGCRHTPGGEDGGGFGGGGGAGARREEEEADEEEGRTSRVVPRESCPVSPAP